MAASLAASSATVPSCSLCARPLQKHDERRVIHCRATSNVWTVLSQAEAEIFSPDNVDALFPAKAYLCRAPCVRDLEKLRRLRESLHKEEHTLRAKLIGLGERKGLSATSQSQGEGGSTVRRGKLIGYTCMVLIFIT